MARSSDDADLRIHQALSHPIRIGILRALDRGPVSAVEISRDTGTPLSKVSYHFHRLLELGLIELASATPRGGAIEPYYVLASSTPAADAGWRALATTAPRAAADTALRTLADEVANAIGSGGLSLPNSGVTSIAVQLDEQGERDATRRVAEMISGLRSIERDSMKRSGDPTASTTPWTVAVLQFRAPSA